MTRSERLKLPDFVLLGILGLILIELFIIPNSGALKSAGGLGTVFLGGRRFVFSDLLVIGFLAVSPFLAFGFPNRERRGRLAPAQYQVLVLCLVLLGGLSLLWGGIRGNDMFMTEVRRFFFTVPLFFVVYFVNFSPNCDRIALKMAVWVLFAFQILNFVGFFFPSLIDKIILDPNAKGPLVGMTCSLLTTSYFLAQIVSGSRSVAWIGLFVLSTLAIVIHIGSKPVILGTFVVWGTVFLIGLRGGIGSFGRIGAATFVVFFGLTSAFMMAPSDMKADLVGKFVSRFFKLSNVVSISEVNLSLLESAGSEGEDVASGRFEIWGAYLGEATKGFGFSRHGFGYDPQIYLAEGETESKGKHNILVYLAYEFGLFAGLAGLFLAGRFLYVEVGERNIRLVEKLSDRTVAERITLISYVCAIAIMSMVGLGVFLPPIAFIFWSCVASLCRERDRINWAQREHWRLTSRVAR